MAVVLWPNWVYNIGPWLARWCWRQNNDLIDTTDKRLWENLKSSFAMQQRNKTFLSRI